MRTSARHRGRARGARSPTVVDDVDAALAALFAAASSKELKLECSFDAPTPEWSGGVKSTTLNLFLLEITEAHPPPLSQGRRSKLRYMTQTKTRPPNFALFGNKLEELPDSYLRYLVNALRDAFDLPGVPIRLAIRRGKNPYAAK